MHLWHLQYHKAIDSTDWLNLSDNAEQSCELIPKIKMVLIYRETIKLAG